MTFTGKMVANIEGFWAAVNAKDYERISSFISTDFRASISLRKADQGPFDKTKFDRRFEFMEFIRDFCIKIDYLTRNEQNYLFPQNHTDKSQIKAAFLLTKCWKLSMEEGSLSWMGTQTWTFEGTQLVALKLRITQKKCLNE